jgi:hypothetical protein
MKLVFLLLVSLAIGCGTREPDAQSILVKKILAECSEGKGCKIAIGAAMPFAWDKLYVFRPGLLDADILESAGIKVDFSEEFSYKYVFIKGNNIVRTEEHHISDFDRPPNGLVRFGTTDAENKFALLGPDSEFEVRIDRRNSGTNFYLTCTNNAR